MNTRVWGPDLLGDGFESMTFDLGPDDTPAHHSEQDQGDKTPENENTPHLAATLVRALPPRRTWWQRITEAPPALDDVDVLYVHGWSDYFFQKDFARFWTDQGATFYAIDLRRYGRSLREGQAPGYISNLDEYDVEIGLAIDEIRTAEPKSRSALRRRLVLVGHSTGGLVLSLWSARNPGAADALILNSPWLEFQFASRGRQLIAPIVRLGARYNPLDSTPLRDQGFYGRAQQEVGPQRELAGLNLEWRPDQVRQLHSGWLNAILAGHRQVHGGLGITTPICVLLSAHSALPLRWSEDLLRADSVLDVQEVAKAALRLGSTVTVEWIDGALHDVFLSAAEPRAEAFLRLDRWVRAWSAVSRPAAR